MSQPKLESSSHPRGTGRAFARMSAHHRARIKRWRGPAAVVALVAALHAALLYGLWSRPRLTPPRTAVPLSVSIATPAESPSSARAAGAAKPKPRPEATRPTRPTPTAPAAMPRATRAPMIESSATSKDSPAPAAAPTSEFAPESAAIFAPRFDAAYLDNPPPAYPALSRRLGEDGRVLLRVFVMPDGHAREVHIERSSGHARLDRAARDAVSRWRFVPAMRAEEPVAAWVRVPISFALKQG